VVLYLVLEIVRTGVKGEKDEAPKSIERGRKEGWISTDLEVEKWTKGRIRGERRGRGKRG